MGIDDKIKWDKKYQNRPELLEKREPSKKLVGLVAMVKGKKALDIACGSGRNSIFLANKNFDVEAFDISCIAIDSLNSHGYKNINTKCIDLEHYIPKQDSYDLIVMTNYLDRDIIRSLLNSLKKDGILFVETYMDHPSNTKPNSNSDFLLKSNELKEFIDKEKFSIIDYDEFDNESYEIYRMKKQSIIVKNNQI